MSIIDTTTFRIDYCGSGQVFSAQTILETYGTRYIYIEQAQNLNF